MALEKSNHATFLSISNGKICKRVMQPTTDSVERVNKNGATVHEEFYDGVSGVLVDIFTKDHQDFGKKWVIKMKDGEEDFQLEMNYSSGYSAAFLKMLPNVDLSKRFKITPKLTMEGDKKKTTLFINQNGVPVKWAYTKDNMNGLPELKKIKVKGKDTWDDSDLMEFLEAMVNADIKPKLGVVPATVAANAEDDIADDLPF